MRKFLLFTTFLCVCWAACKKGGYTQLSNGKCYKLTRGTYTYFRAADTCQADGTQMATLHSKADNDAIAEYLASGLWEEAWIGLQCTGAASCFWDDGTPFDYINFNANPDFSNGRNCVMLKAGLTMPMMRDVYNGWTPKSCQTATDNVLCEEIPDGIPTCGDYEEFNGMCYKSHDRVPSWMVAESICAMEGGHLISIHNILQNTFLFNMMKANGVNSVGWIGLYSLGSHYYWADSTPVDYYNIAGGSIYNPSCYAMSTTNLLSPSQWISEDCNTQYPFVCARAPGNPVTIPPFTPPPMPTTMPNPPSTMQPKTTGFPSTNGPTSTLSSPIPTAPTLPNPTFPSAPPIPEGTTTLFPSAPTVPSGMTTNVGVAFFPKENM